MSRKLRMEQFLIQEITPYYLSVEDESSNHHVPPDGESHFKIIVVSDDFKEMTRVARHRVINHLLQNEFEKGLHALSIHVFTVYEWENQTVLQSPPCKDGYTK